MLLSTERWIENALNCWKILKTIILNELRK
nr:MAG TPA: hypothetical protein [Caudoviricetes sp.]